ncbi:hypothetical protein ACYFX5_05890 [Bremerella sp. T1]|uniref:hypothetical protein n=1 Tax=Bremerella sp. TYQ1 TaxID=3119568 RepID=UPI001CCA31E8|nr:hypothetical protein [Bremerella volcania]UBM37789.1 hypothetical protein LA756_07830 [Bremerella volcania]
MLSYRKALWGLVIAANLAVASSVQAQYETEFPGALQPFSDVNLDNYDFQWFAPPITEQYGQDTIDPNTGIFFEYHRLFMNVSRSDVAPGPWDGDATYGNRLDFGYMTDENYGWLMSGWRLDGPSYDDVNRADFNSFEVNRTWRLPQFHKGFWIEPMVGLRFGQFNDKTEELIFVQNNMLLGQLGGRIFSQRGQWTLYSTVRAFGGQNWIFRGDISDYTNGVAGGEFSLGAAYHITREITIDVAWQHMYFGTGIGRDPFFDGDNDDMTFSGVAFGFTLNR